MAHARDCSDRGRFVRSLDDADLQAPSRCEGWTAGDVAAHVIGQISDITVGRFDGLGTAGDLMEFVLVATGRADPASFGLDEAVNVYR